MAEPSLPLLASFGMATASLAGALPQRLAAVRAAGFSQVMLTAAELASHAEGLADAVRMVRASGLRVMGLQALTDYEGLSGRPHAHKVDVAKGLLELCSAVGARLLVVCSTTSADAAAEPEVAIRDLRKLAMLALPLGVRIAYRGLAWGRHVTDFVGASDIACRADVPNLGFVVDAFHAIAARTPLDEIELLDPSKIFLVQLSDHLRADLGSAEERIATEHRGTVFPGEGVHDAALVELVQRLDRLGYRGDFSLAPGHDDHAQLPASAVAERAKRSALWLAEDVLQLSAPLPGKSRMRPA